ncbi:MAG: DUF11 domain-containing protein [Lachnospiraceae bacterium]|nr:DUF11 domain-containing protein [Lachnospiraceae bacterium]
MTKQKKYSFAQRLLALALAMVLGFSLIPTDGLVTFATSTRKDGGTLGVVQTADDPHTLTRPGDTFLTSSGLGSTLNAGKILVGKSVTDGIVDGGTTAETLNLSGELTNMPSGTKTSWLPGQNNFLVTISQSSQMYGITSKIPVPLDVVFVIDTSGSMKTSVGNNKDRAEAVMAAANSAIKTLLSANDDNRVGVVAFSGNNGTDSDRSRSTTVLTALGRYNPENNHLSMDDRSGNLVGKTGSRNAKNGGTNIQMGIAAGAKMLMAAEDLTVTYGDRTVTRIPVLVVLSDGAPTFSSSALDWTNPTGGENGKGSSDRGDDPGEGFLAMLTAAYYKNAITEKYYGANATADQRAFIYTIGVGLGNINNYSGAYSATTTATLANLTMNPSQWLGVSIGNNNNTIDDDINTAWSNYQNKRDFTIQVGRYSDSEKTYSFRYHAASTLAQYNIDPSVTSLKYNDKYWSANSTDEINSAFSEMVIEIQKRAITAPTLTNTIWGQDYSGFVTFTDPIGEYMEVKNIIGVTGEGYLYQGISLSKLAQGYNPTWETDTTTTDEQAAFNAALEQAFMDRMSLSTAAGAATPSLAQVRSILDVITRTESEGDVTYDAGGGNTRTFDYPTYGGQFYYNSDSDFGNSFVWFGKIHYPDGETEAATGNADYDVQFIGVAPKNADSIDWLHQGGADAVALRESAKAAGANCIVRSYFMYGAAGGNREEEPADMLHFQLRVLTSLEEPHQQYVSVKAPASLLAFQKVLIDDTDPGNLEAHYEKLVPSRVIYEVGLRSDINANTVWDIVDGDYLTEKLSDGTLANVNADGTINFYTNDWDRAASVESHERALAHANFEVSNNNSFYRYEVNTPLYADAEGNTPLTTKPVVNGTYWYERTYYTWTIEDDGVSGATQHTEMIKVTAPADQTMLDTQCAQDTSTGQWYILAGVYSDETLTAGDDIVKTENTTGTASVVTHPTRDAATSDPKYTTWLGNNGKLVFAGLKLKNVTGDDITSAGAETAAEIDGKPVKVGDVLTYTLQAVNNEADAAKIVFEDTIPAGTVLVADSITASVGGAAVNNAHSVDGRKITWTFENVAPGVMATVSFQVTVQESAVTDIITNQGIITVGTNRYTTNVTSNPVTGKQATTSTGEAVPADGLKVGDEIEYRISYYNSADEAATITITDIVPKGTAFNGITSHEEELVWNKDTNPNTLTWTLTNVQPGTHGVVTFTVTIDASIEKTTVGDVLDVENSATYIIDPENGPDVTIETNPTQTLVDTGELQLKKVVEGIIIDADHNPEFTLMLTESTGKLTGEFAATINGAPASTNVVFSAGTASVAIHHNDTILISGLPEGVNITVTETAKSGYTPKFYLGADTGAAEGNQVTINDTTAASVLVANTYSTAPTADISTMFSIKKSFTSTVSLGDRSFTFLAQAANAAGEVLTGNEAETLTTSGIVKAGQTVFENPVTFAGKTFSAPGTYYYLVTEYEGALTGVTYDKSQYLVTIVVTDNKAGQLNTVVSVQKRADSSESWSAVGTDEIAFSNSYKPTDTSISLSGTKTLNGRKLTAGEFTFVATETGVPAGVVREEEVVRYGHHDADGKITFDPIYYSKDGEYTYKITELTTTGQQHVTFDQTEYEVVVTVTNTDGVLKATVTSITTVKNAAGEDVSETATAISFVNTYTTQDVFVTPVGTKTLTNRDSGSFNFAVYAWDAATDTVISTTPASTGSVAITAAGTPAEISFSPIDYSLSSFGTKPTADTTKIFTYMVEELIPTVGSDPQITYDRSRYTFQVELTYTAQTGELSANIVENSWKKVADNKGAALGQAEAATAAAFTNLYTPPIEINPGEVAAYPEVVKRVESNGQIPAGLTFGFQIIKAADAIAPDGTVINDNYKVGDVVGTGTSVGTAGAAAGNGQVSETTKITFSTLNFSKPGTYQAWIVENNAGQDIHGVKYDANRYLMVIDVTMDGNGTLSADITYYRGTGENPGDYTEKISDEPGSQLAFVNNYSASGSLNILTAKVLNNASGSNRPFVAGMFDFTLTEEGGGAVHTGTNDASGVVRFDTLTFANEGFDADGKKTLTYIMKETPGVLAGITYDKSEYRLTIELTNTNGVITGDVIRIEKVVDASGATVNALVYDKSTDPVSGTEPTVTGNTVDVNVSGAAFANTASNHTGSEVDIPLSKTLTGRDMVDGEFSFTLTHVGTSLNGVDQTVEPAVVSTVHSAAAAEGVAAALNFHREYSANVAPGTVITYWIDELIGSKGGITYDKSRYEVKVTVSDANSDGDLEAAVTGIMKIRNADGTAANDVVDGISFENSYAPAGTTLTLEGTKTLTGRDIDEGEFVFEVYKLVDSGNGLVRGELATTGAVVAGAEGTAAGIVFDPISYSEAGTYYYEAVERAGNRNNVTYSKAVFRVVVEVAEDETNGTLSAAVKSITKTADDAGTACSAENSAISFTNTYEPDPLNIAAQLSIDKKLTGRDMTASEFDFTVTLVKKDNETRDEVVSYGNNQAAVDGENAKIAFASFTVNEAGTYIYKITESTVAGPNVTTDTDPIFVKVEVDDDSNGKLSILGIIYAADDTFAESSLLTAPGFENTYDPDDVDQTLTANKGVTGIPLAEGRFGFTAQLQKKDAAGAWTNVDGATVTGKNTAVGLVNFEKYTFTEPGEYRWIVTEDQKLYPDTFQLTGGVMNFDKTEFRVYVTIEDDSSAGALYIVTDSVVYKKLVNNAEEAVNAINFSNVFVPTGQYKPLDAVMRPEGSKVLNGRDLEAGEFSFTVTDVQGNPVATGKNDADGNISFNYSAGANGIKFSAVGTYFYTISEVNDPELKGVTFDPAKWTVRFDVTQDPGTGELIVSDPTIVSVTDTTAADTTKVVFTNTYDPKDAEVTLAGYKMLTGRDGLAMMAGEFEFHLVNASGNVVAKGYNDAAGTITFEKLVFASEVTDLELKVIEVNKGAEGVTYDDTEIVVTITVTDDTVNGVLVPAVKIGGAGYDANKTGEDAQIKFVNSYKGTPTTVTFDVTKELSGKKLRAGEFSFELKDMSGNAVLDENNNPIIVTNDEFGVVRFTVPVTDAKKYEWVISEVIPAGAPTTTTADQYAGAVDQYNGFVAYDDSKYVVTVEVIDNLSGKLLVDSVAYDTTDGLAPVFKNEYRAETTATVEAKKAIIGKDLADVTGLFSFLIVDTKGTADEADDVVLSTKGTNKADGSIAIDLGFDKAGTYNYYLVEQDETGKAGYGGYTFDGTRHPFIVNVSADAATGELTATITYANGTHTSDIVFNNSYDSEDCEVTLTGTKTLTGGNRKMAAGDFSFVVKLVENGTVTDKIVARGTNTADGMITFYGVDGDGSLTNGGIKYSAPGNYTYEVSEVKGDEPGMSYDTKTYTVVVKVEDVDGVLIPTVTYSDGTATNNIAFENTFAPVAIKVTLEGKKVMMGRDLTDGEFRFEVHDSSGNLVGNGINRANGTIDFSEITLPQEGTYTLTVTEVHGGEAFVTYDLDPQTVIVVVTNENGLLAAEVQYPAEGLVFVNVYDEPQVPPVTPSEPAPDTGDHTMMAVWGILSGLSGVTAITTASLRAVYNKRRKRGHDGHEEV